MKAVKLSELKVGDQVYDMATDYIGIRTLFEVKGFEPGTVWMEFISGDKYPVDPARFSTYTNESFYKLQLSDLTFDHADKWNEIRITNPDAPGSNMVFTKGQKCGFNEFVAEMIDRYDNPAISVQNGRVTIHSEKFISDIKKQNSECQSWCEENTEE